MSLLSLGYTQQLVFFWIGISTYIILYIILTYITLSSSYFVPDLHHQDGRIKERSKVYWVADWVYNLLNVVLRVRRGHRYSDRCELL